MIQGIFTSLGAASRRVAADYPTPKITEDYSEDTSAQLEYSTPQTYQGKILVPFPVESALSGVTKPITPDNLLWYRRN